MMDHLAKALAHAELVLATKRATKSSPLPSPLASSSYSSELETSSVSGAQEQYARNRGAVYSCVRLISSRAAGQPWQLGRVVNGKAASFATKALGESLPSTFKAMAPRIDPVESHPLLDLLNDPYESLTAWTLKWVTVASMELCGRAVWLLDEEKSTGKRSIFPLPVSWVREIDFKRGVWIIRLPGGEDIPIPSERIVHFYYPNPSSPHEALSPLAAIGHAVVADETIQAAQASAFANGLYPGLAIYVGKQTNQAGQEYTPELTPEQRKQLINTILKAAGGVFKFGHPIILDGMIEKLSTITNKPDEMGFLESSKITESRIEKGYGVSPLLLGDVEGGNRAQATMAEEIFLANKINPLLALLSQTATEWLCPWFAKPNEKLVLWLPECVAHDPEVSVKKFALTREDMTRNERRAFAGLPPIKGGDKIPSEPKFAAIGRSLKDE